MVRSSRTISEDREMKQFCVRNVRSAFASTGRRESFVQFEIPKLYHSSDLERVRSRDLLESSADLTKSRTRNSLVSLIAPAGPESHKKLENARRLGRNMALQPDFPMYCVRIADVLTMTSVESFEVLTEREQLIVHEPTEERPVIFVSHQWLSTDHPDPDATQFRILQQALTNLRAGVLDVHTNSLRNVCATANGVGNTQINWKHVLHDALIWYDYFSVPQCPKSDAAIQSIPAYVERSTYMFVLAPPLEHRDFVTRVGGPSAQVRVRGRGGDDSTDQYEPLWCDFRTWQGRGWCQMEQICSLCKVTPNVVVVVESARYVYYPFHSWSMVHKLLNECTYTCCQMNHIKEHPDGSVEKVPCDRKSVYNVTSALLDWRMKLECATVNSRAYRQSRVFGSNMRLSVKNNAPMAISRSSSVLWRDPSNDTLREFLTKNHFMHAREKCGGWSPLRLACVGGHISVVEQLLARPGMDLECPLESRTEEACFGLETWPTVKGINIVAYVASVCSSGAHEAILDMLIAAGADPYGGPSGIHVLFAATLHHLKDKRSMRWVFRTFPNFDVDLPVAWFDMKMRPLTMAACLGDEVAISLLLQHGAQIVGSPGRSVFWTCCAGGDGASSDAAHTVYDRITTHNSQHPASHQIPFDVNERNEIPADRLARLKIAVSLRIGPVSYAKEEILWHGSTPLFAAASRGKHRTVQWLLSLDADPVLTNVQGTSPMDIAVEREFLHVVHVLEEALRRKEKHDTLQTSKNRFGEVDVYP
eukprot:GEMP01003088.1.p1 GENE.GEMP01003088.1~~GEMP01003088.1.p1  ORF type:complete len:760 (+),score=188.40 GEMP01003088.1:430-2709(+)